MTLFVLNIIFLYQFFYLKILMNIEGWKTQIVKNKISRESIEIICNRNNCKK